MKRVIYTILASVVFMMAIGCSKNNKRATTTNRNPYYTGNQYGQQFYNNCGQQSYYNPYNQQQMQCQMNGNNPAFFNPNGQMYSMDMYGNPCMTGQIDPYSGYCMDYSYYPTPYGW